GHNPDSAPVCNRGAARASTRFFDCARFDIEAPRQDERHRETEGNKNDEQLLGPIRRMKDRQYCPDDLDRSRPCDGVGNGDAINASIFQFLKEALHVGSGLSSRCPPWPIMCTHIADVSRRHKRVLRFSGKPAVPLTRRYWFKRGP